MDDWLKLFRSRRGKLENTTQEQREKELDSSLAAFRRARDQLLNARAIGIWERWVWIT
jgi:hypothetical protein